MGPRPKARKNCSESSCRARRALGVLQWGRARRRGRTHSWHAQACLATHCFNGAAPEGAEEPGVGRAIRPALVASMGPRPKARKNSPTASLRSSARALQWGRARRRGRTHRLAGTWASWGWLQWGRARRRGRTQSHCRGGCPTWRFNGAAPEGAEERSVVRFVSTCRYGFNGAAPEGAEERPQAPRPRGAQAASMGPRPKARKNGRNLSPRVAAVLGFNGAAPEGAEEHRTRAETDGALQGFNGAAPEGAEEPAGTGSAHRRVPRLQWGRARRRGRTELAKWPFALVTLASMGPRPKARKNSPVGRVEAVRDVASMGPRPKARKNRRLAFWA